MKTSKSQKSQNRSDGERLGGSEMSKPTYVIMLSYGIIWLGLIFLALIRNKVTMAGYAGLISLAFFGIGFHLLFKKGLNEKVLS